jgi:hypothetical protein
MRWRTSSGDGSSRWVATIHLWPKGSVMLPARSPQNWSATGMRAVAPSASAFFTVASASGT